MKVLVRKQGGTEAAPVIIHTEFIRLDDAIKFANALPSGGMAKQVIQSGAVTVNGEICFQRGKKLYPGDRFSFQGKQYQIYIHEGR
ncbi:MAG TPA: RNA-binding S4 domain-containing protein [Candidatus Faecousia intestinigallinarum]|nr:RNA-binding S4 domain-containing protein [Candidatus Faecousia intestinigallinarum]